MNRVSISYAITACNEHIELKRLLDQLLSYIEDNDEIVVQLDTTATDEVISTVKEYFDRVTFTQYSLNNDFASFKNNLKSNCLISISKNILKLGTIKNGFFNPANYSLGQRSQDLLPNYFENGLIYISHSNSILNENSIISGNILPYIVDHQFPIVDIDEEIDFVYGEFLFNKNIELFNYLL